MTIGWFNGFSARLLMVVGPLLQSLSPVQYLQSGFERVGGYGI
jgi:hypothetical protein